MNLFLKRMAKEEAALASPNGKSRGRQLGATKSKHSARAYVERICLPLIRKQAMHGAPGGLRDLFKQGNPNGEFGSAGITAPGRALIIESVMAAAKSDGVSLKRIAVKRALHDFIRSTDILKSD